MQNILRIDRDAPGSLQAKLREKISETIARGGFEESKPLPSTRALAEQLGVSRNTVTAVYQELASEGVLFVRDRHAFFVAPNASANLALPAASPTLDQVDWNHRLAVRPSALRNMHHPADWRSKRYTFIYGQHDRWLFPISNWRKCSRDSLSLHDMHDWTVDYVDADDPLLLDAFRRRVLPRRGFVADGRQVLVTVGAQHALFLIAQALVKPGTVVGVENPSYADARNIFKLFGAVVKPIPVDDEGLIVDDRLTGCDLVYVTPNHQAPTTVSMSENRRRALLSAARANDQIIIEDDYDTEPSFGAPSGALRSLDTEGRVLYMTSLSKLLSPGLRVGFLVAPTAFIDEVRVLRRLGIRHPPANNQRTLALFLKGGHYEALLKRFHAEYEKRWLTLRDAVAKHIPDAVMSASHGGSSIWLRLPDNIDCTLLADRAYERDVHIESSSPHFEGPEQPRCFLRLGFSSIRAEDIEPGIAILADVVNGLRVSARPSAT